MTTTQENMAERPEKPKRQPMCMPERCGLASDNRNDWIVTTEPGIRPDDLLDPGYWAHVANQFTAFDTIEARAEDGSWIAFLRVLYTERTYAKVKMEREVFYVEENATLTDAKAAKFKVEWKGPHHKFVVIRNEDSTVLKNQFKSREEATAWMLEHEKAQTGH